MQNIRIRQAGSLMVMIIALVMSITVHASASAQLYSNEYYKSTACIGRTGSGFACSGNVGVSSQYCVTFKMYDGSDSSNCNHELYSDAFLPGATVPLTPRISNYSVGRLFMCGNTIDNQKKNCIATGGIYAY